MRRYLEAVDRHRRTILIASALVCLASALSVLRLQLDVNPLGMLPSGTRAFADYRAFLERFGTHSQLLTVIEGSDEATTLAFGRAYAALLARSPTVASVRLLFDPLAFSRTVLARHLPVYLPADDLQEVRRLLGPDAIAERVRALRRAMTLPVATEVGAVAREDPLGLQAVALRRLAPAGVELAAGDARGFFLSDDGRALLVSAEPRQGAFDVDFAADLIADAQAAATAARAEHGEWADVRVRFGGGHAHVLEDTGTISRDLIIYTTLAPLVILGIFHLAYRNLLILAFVTYPLVVGLLVTFALSQLLFERLDLMSLAFSAIFYGLAIDAGIHFYTRLLQEGDAATPLDAMAATVRSIGPTHVIASTTTAVVFLILGLSHIRGVAQLGQLTALAMCLNIGAMLLIFPALLFGLARRATVLDRAAATLDTPRLGRLTGWVAPRRLAPAAVVAVAVVSVMLARQGVTLDTNFEHLRPPDSEPTRTEDEIAARFGSGGLAAAVVTDGPTVEAALRRAETVAAVLDDHRLRGSIAGFEGPTALLPSIRTQRLRAHAWRTLPRADAAVALRDALVAAGFRAEAFAAPLAGLLQARPALVVPGPTLPAPLQAAAGLHLRRDGARASVATFVRPAPSVDVVELAPRLRADLAARGVRATIGSRALMEAELGRVLGREVRLFLVLGLAANVLIVWLAFRRLRPTLAVMLPPALTLAIFVAALAASGYALTPITIVVLPLLLGISVDDCVYLAERHRAGGSLAEIGRRGGRAVVMSSLTTIVGFGFLAFSRFPGLAQLGTLTAAAIGLALVVSLTVLPVALHVLQDPPDTLEPSPPLD